MIFTPAEANAEFAVLLTDIIEELSKNKDKSLKVIKNVCLYLTVKDDPSTSFFNENQQDAIIACGSIETLFIKYLRLYWRWDDFAILTRIVQSLDPTDHCLQLIHQYEKKIYSEIKLKDIHEYCKRENKGLPEGYHKVVAIVKNKSFLRITLEEYMKLKEFILQHCEIKPYVISPFTDAWFGSLLLEWFVPSTAVQHMIEMATVKANVFIAQNFMFLKISSKVIFDKRDNVS